MLEEELGCTRLGRGSKSTSPFATSASLSHALRPTRHKAPQNVWRDKHEAAVLMRAASLVYLRAKVSGSGDDGDDATSTSRMSSGLGSLLRLLAARACRPGVMRQLEGGKARELLAAAAHLGCTFPAALSLAILEELARDSGEGCVQGGDGRDMWSSMAVMFVLSEMHGDKEGQSHGHKNHNCLPLSLFL